MDTQDTELESFGDAGSHIYNEILDGLNLIPLKGRILQCTSLAVFSAYIRIFMVVLLLNVSVAVVFISGVLKGYRTADMDQISAHPSILVDILTMVSADLLAAILIRQDFVINTIFRLSLLVSKRAPLQLRCMFAKVYEYGGFHSGAAVCSVLWFTAFSVIILTNIKALGPVLLTCTLIIWMIFAAMLVLAFPKIRFNHHNAFEYVHRWGTVVTLFLMFPELHLFHRELAFNASPDSPTPALIQLPAYWLFVISVILLLLPWLRLRKLSMDMELLSDRAVRLRLFEGVENCTVYRIALRRRSATSTHLHAFMMMI